EKAKESGAGHQHHDGGDQGGARPAKAVDDVRHKYGHGDRDESNQRRDIAHVCVEVTWGGIEKTQLILPDHLYQVDHQIIGHSQRRNAEKVLGIGEVRETLFERQLSFSLELSFGLVQFVKAGIIQNIAIHPAEQSHHGHTANADNSHKDNQRAAPLFAQSL